MVKVRWEKIDSTVDTGWRIATVPLSRCSVPGGWLVNRSGAGDGDSITFVPDPKHSWN